MSRFVPWSHLAAMAAMASAACVSTTSYERGAFERIHDDSLGKSASESCTAASNAPDTSSKSVLARVHGPRYRAHAAVIDGSLESYVAYAMCQNPGLMAEYEDWRAAAYAIEERRRLPDPVINYGVFLRRVETRVGPQRQRFGVRQMIPWPGKRQAASAAASDMAGAAERRFEARALAIVGRVAAAYWQLWMIQEIRAVETAQRELVLVLADTARTRLALGKASLADVTQIDLEVLRRDDMLASLDEREIGARAALRQAIGAPADMELPMAAPTPLAVVPAESTDALLAAARAHPRVSALDYMAAASEHAADAADAQGMPDFTLGLDYIETGAAAMPNVPDSGKDPIMVSIAVAVPLWRGTYDAAENKARAQAAAYRARRHEAETMAEAELQAVLAQVRDAARRIALYENTLIPQAETAYAAVIGTYQTGAAQLANALIAQKNVLELNNLLARARADHARAWARLEEIVGRPVAASPLATPDRATPDTATPGKATPAPGSEVPNE